jgi:hypothetical protein
VRVLEKKHGTQLWPPENQIYGPSFLFFKGLSFQSKKENLPGFQAGKNKNKNKKTQKHEGDIPIVNPTVPVEAMTE